MILNKLNRFFANRKIRNSINKHLPASSSRLTKIVNSDIYAYLRPSFSDLVRIDEYNKSIYIPQNHLTDKIKEMNPVAIFDIGGNIGLSTLALSQAFPNCNKIVSVEAEYQNHAMLTKNMNYWSQANQPLYSKKIFSLYAIASCTAEKNAGKILAKRLPGGLSASGTFTFNANLTQEYQSEFESNFEDTGIVCSKIKVSMNDLFNEHTNSSDIGIVKIDIEGGEEELFSQNTEWLSNTAFMTIEIHDVMGAINSSKNLISCIASYDFAIVPENDVLHCYNRKFLSQ